MQSVKGRKERTERMREEEKKKVNDGQRHEKWKEGRKEQIVE